ncbi:DUF1156 domain-containing protein [Actinomadura vinacea]|uniref:DUF1156 domain-containing protein n=1 Tax=Actinomadura vinacea TaxID=115336 RepID=A0ABP5VKX8_9ACTN
MTRMIERWFPCAEVSDASMAGWGSGNSEASLWVWFAKRPTAQARAAVLTSLLPWPEDEAEQKELQAAVRGMLAIKDAKTMRAATMANGPVARIRAALAEEYPGGTRILDPFSGRAMIPLEAGRLGVAADGIDYSPFAALGGALLAEIPFKNWDDEPPLPFQENGQDELTGDRLERDVEAFLAEVGRRYTESMAEFYPKHEDRQPWGYLWASTLPCQECGNRFPLVGELWLRFPRDRTAKRDADDGQSFDIFADPATGEFQAVPHGGEPEGKPTRVLAGKSKYSSEGRVAICPFCNHVHPKVVHTRLSAEGLRRDALLLAADIADDGTKVFREPSEAEIRAVELAEESLGKEPPFGLLSACPVEPIPPGNTWTIQSVNYGDKTYGDLVPPRQTLGLVRLARSINDLAEECLAAGLSASYVRALSGFATAAMMRKLRRSSRGARLQKAGGAQVGDIFVNQSAISHAYDWFESGLSDGPGSWASLAEQTMTVLRGVRSRSPSVPASIQRGSATMLPYRDGVMTAVVTDPPYDDMIDYSDSSDLFYVWAKRAMFTADPSLAMTMHPDGVQEKDEEIIVKRGGSQADDHRTMQHYDSMISRAYAEMRRVVANDGVVTIVFGHNDLKVWHRMLSALSQAKLVMTSSWPAKTEAGGAGAGALNVVTTLTMSCRPAASDQQPGSLAAVENQIRAEIADRFRLWERSGLARQDMLMASAGPAMEIAGRYSKITRNTGEPVELVDLLATARRAVQEIALEKINSVPLELFDERTRFALWWIELFRRDQVALSEFGWHSFTSGLAMKSLQTLVKRSTKGCRFVQASQFNAHVTERSALIDVVLAMARAWAEGDLADVARVLMRAGRDPEDEQLWATIAFLTDRLPQADPDVRSWHAISRESRSIRTATHLAQEDRLSATRERKARDSQTSLF